MTTEFKSKPSGNDPIDPEHIRYLATHPEMFNPTVNRKPNLQRFLAGRDKKKSPPGSQETRAEWSERRTADFERKQRIGNKPFILNVPLPDVDEFDVAVAGEEARQVLQAVAEYESRLSWVQGEDQKGEL
ncbi:hypothetical protein HK097_005287 [Rhizophlyctis rosea]|uniref:Uncharacterized protein n=1 Tax=Rhizophlyctis rosea TaxID=64517 RepID=A0AAD5SGT8_9FUNG|nr:hypothetical protein HK097_005287 [Rhizophlyctis rosea]